MRGLIGWVLRHRGSHREGQRAPTWRTSAPTSTTPPPSDLERGRPIATGIIEGACRHLIKDRLDITGARRSLPGAEAVLKLRALIGDGDYGPYFISQRGRADPHR